MYRRTIKKSSYILVSACLVGINCRYDGRHCLQVNLLRELRAKPLLVICPELLGGLPTPRPPAQLVFLESGSSVENAGWEVIKGRASIVWSTGGDVTHSFIRGAENVMRLIKLLAIKRAYLKSRSPSCGLGIVSSWDPAKGFSFPIPGDGVLTTLVRKAGIKIISV